MDASKYTLPGVMHYLQLEFSKMERYRVLTNLEVAEMRVKITRLEGERASLEHENSVLRARVAELEGRSAPSEPVPAAPEPPLQLRDSLPRVMREILYLLKAPTVHHYDHLGLKLDHDFFPVDQHTPEEVLQRLEFLSEEDAGDEPPPLVDEMDVATSDAETISEPRPRRREPPVSQGSPLQVLSTISATAVYALPDLPYLVAALPTQLTVYRLDGVRWREAFAVPTTPLYAVSGNYFYYAQGSGITAVEVLSKDTSDLLVDLPPDTKLISLGGSSPLTLAASTHAAVHLFSHGLGEYTAGATLSVALIGGVPGERIIGGFVVDDCVAVVSSHRVALYDTPLALVVWTQAAAELGLKENIVGCSVHGGRLAFYTHDGVVAWIDVEARRSTASINVEGSVSSVHAGSTGVVVAVGNRLVLYDWDLKPLGLWDVDVVGGVVTKAHGEPKGGTLPVWCVDVVDTLRVVVGGDAVRVYPLA